jgi:hypothetical protein
MAKLAKLEQTEETEKDFFKAVQQIKGAVGLLVLTHAILSKKTYRTAILSERHKGTINLVDTILTELSDLKSNIKKYANEQKEWVTKKSEYEQLRARMPKDIEAKRLTEVEKIEEKQLGRTKNKLQNQLLIFYKNLPRLNKQIQNIFADPEVQKEITRKRKLYEKEPWRRRFRPERERPERDWSRYPRRPFKMRDRPARDAGAAPGEVAPKAEREEPDEAEKEDEKRWSQARDKEKKPKDEVDKEIKDAEEKRRLEEQSLENLYEKAIKLIEKIVSFVKPDQSLIDVGIKRIWYA